MLKSILSILFHWQNGGYLPKSRPRSYIHMIIWRDAARSIPIRFVFVIFTIQWLIFLRMIWFFFSTHKFHLYVEMSNLLNLKKIFYIDIWLSNKIFPTSKCPLVQPTYSHYFSNFYPLFDPKPNYIIQNTMIYHRFPLKIFFVLFLSKKKIKEFRYGKNAKHVKVNFVDDVLAIDLKKIEGRW